MESNIQVIGEQADVIYYNINKQFSNVKKVIITKNAVLSSFEDNKISELIENLKNTTTKNYKNILDENRRCFDTTLSHSMYENIQEKLNEISNQYMDVKLKDFNFMNTMSSFKFNIAIRCENFSITKYYIEKGAILSNILNLIQSYFNFEGNKYRINRLENFQIEIYSAEDIHKTVFLKKEGNNILLSATLGFLKNRPIDYSIGSEFYVSKGNDFKYFKSKQNTMILREHGNLVEKSISIKDKVLNNDELIKINEKTKNIDDALVEAYINAKGQLKILNVSINENHIGKYSEHGFVINKSLKSYDRISLLNLRDDITEETINPKYLLLKNENEVKEFIDDISIVENYDGVLLTYNFYSQMLDKIGKTNNIDFLFIDKNITKSLDEKIDWTNIDIENSNSQNSEENLFASIMQKEEKQRDEHLEKLRSIDLSTPSKVDENKTRHVESVVNNIIGSENSSFGNNNGGNSQMYGSLSGNGEKKSALSFLADAAMVQQQKNKEIKEQVVQTQQSVPNQGYNNGNMMNQQVQSVSVGNQMMQQRVETEQVLQQPVVDPIQQAVREQMQVSRQFVSEPVVQNIPEPVNMVEEVKTGRYDDVLVTEIIAEPGVNCESYFVDITTISQVTSGKIYFLTLNPEEMQNSNINYVMPIGLSTPELSGCHFLIKNVQDFFLINKNQDVGYFVNICDMPNEIKKNFISDIIEKVGKISVICLRKDLYLFESYINKIESIKVKDISSTEDVLNIKKEVLTLEKKFLMNKN